MACATDWSGMSSEDLPNVVEITQDVSRFPSLVDRTQQGFLNFMFLGRLMVHPQGFAAHPDFAGKIDTTRLFYAGASQGGVLGGALTAVAPDFERAALIVPAMNFSLLLPRSTQFARFADVLYPSYPDQLERPLLTSMIQILWDRGEANGYAWHMTRSPLPRHAETHRAPPRGVRGPPGRERRDGGRGSRDRRSPAHPRSTRAAVATHARSSASRASARFRSRGTLSWCSTSGRCGRAGSALQRHRSATCRRPPESTPTRSPASSPPRRSVTSEFLKLGGAFVNTCGERPCYAAGWTGP